MLAETHVVPGLVTVVLHSLLLWLLSANWDLAEPERFVKPQIINAKLVKLEQVQATPVKAQPKPKPCP